MLKLALPRLGIGTRDSDRSKFFGIEKFEHEANFSGKKVLFPEKKRMKVQKSLGRRERKVFINYLLEEAV